MTMITRRKRLLGGTIASGAFIIATALAGTPALAATAPPADSSEVIEIPMTLFPHSSTGMHAQPNIVVPGNCGTAFLHVSRTQGDEAHIDFGFSTLKIHAVWVSGQVTAFNDGTGKNKHQTWSGATALVTSWEKQTNLVTGSGEVHTIATITASGALSDCVSSPALFTDTYIY